MKFKYNLDEKELISADRDGQSALSFVLDKIKGVGFGRASALMGWGSCDMRDMFYLAVGELNDSGNVCVLVNILDMPTRESVCELLDEVIRDLSPSSICSVGDLLSRGAIRASLKRMYSSNDVYAVASKEQLNNPAVCLGIFRQMLSFVDTLTASEYVFACNCTDIASDRRFFLIDKDNSDMYYGAFPYNLEKSADKHTLIDRLADYLLTAEIGDKNRLLAVLSKYGKYAADEDDSSRGANVYGAFVEGDEEALFQIVRSYWVETCEKGLIPEIDAGIRSVIRPVLTDRAVLKMIYDGYDSCGFTELLAKNKAVISFCSAFRGVDSLFTGDNAASYNILLASRITSDAEDSDIVRSLVEDEIARVEKLLDSAENSLEFAMINAYCKVLAVLSRRVEDVADIELDTQSIEDNEDNNETSAFDTGIASADVCEKSSDAIGYKELATICSMTRDNYLDAYALLFGSDYLNEFIEESEEEGRKREILLSLYGAKLSVLFENYMDFKDELMKQESLADNAALKLIVKDRYSDMLCYALEDCDKDSFIEIISGYDTKKVDDRVFFPALYSKACSLARECSSCGFIDTARDKCDNEIIDTLLLAAKFTCSREMLPQYFFIDLEELVSKFFLIEGYINGDIVFNASIHGTKYCGISLKMYMDARQGTNTESVAFAAENSVDFNNFLAEMKVEGFEIKSTASEAVYPPSADSEDEESLFEHVDDRNGGDGDASKVNECDREVVVIIDEKKPVNKKSTNRQSKEEYSDRGEDDYEDPRSYKVIVKNESAEKMKLGIVALSALTVIALIIFIILLNG